LLATTPAPASSDNRLEIELEQHGPAKVVAPQTTSAPAANP